MGQIKDVYKKTSFFAILFAKKSLKTKIIILIMSATIPIILSGMLNYFLNNYYMSEYFSIHERLLTIDTILEDTFEMLPVVREYISDPLLKDHRLRFENYRKDIEKSVSAITGEENDEKRNLFINDITLFIHLCEEIMDASDRNDPSVRSNYNKISFQADNVKRSAIDLTMQELNYGNDLRKQINKKIWEIYFVSLIIVIVLIVSIFIMISIVMKRVVAGLKELEDLSQKVTHGDFDLSVIGIEGNDEIGLLARAFNDMVLSLKAAYKEIDKRQRKLQSLNKDLTDANKQLLRTNEDLKNAQEQIIQSEKLASLGSLVAGVSHEINTPIGVSVTAASFLRDKNQELVEKIGTNTLTRKEFENYAGVIIETSDILLTNLKRAAELIGSFKMIAVDQTSEESREIDLQDYIEDVILSLKHVLKKTSVIVNLVCEEKDLKIITYPGFLVQVLTNLIMNSVIHGFETTKKGLIEIAVKRVDDSIVIQYRDDGKGMSKEVLKRIFEPFYTTNRGQGGSGLGMFIVYNIVTKYFNGTIECESTEGRGVTFTIKIPLITKENK